MKLIIDKNPYITKNFIRYLIIVIKFFVSRKINKQKFIRMNNYVNDNNLFNSRTMFNASNIIYHALNNLIIIDMKDMYVVTINETINAPGFNIPLSDLCRFINYGNSDIKGVPIFTNAFKHIKNNVVRYYRKYRGR